MLFKLKYKIALLQIIVGCSILFLGIAFNYKYSYQLAQQKAQEYLLNDSKKIASQVNFILQEKVEKVKTLASAPIIEQLLSDSNFEFSNALPESRAKHIEKLNRQWMATADKNSPFIQPYLINPVANYFSQQFDLNPGEYGEIFLTNRYGALVASTGKLTTLAHGHKYWWAAAYNEDKGQVFIDDRGFDNSVQGYVLGIVVPIKKDGHVIGVLKSNIMVHGTLEKIMTSSNRDHLQHSLVRDTGTVILAHGTKPLSSKVNPLIEKAMTAENDGFLVFKENNIPTFAAFTSIAIGKNLAFGGKPGSIDHHYGNQGEGWNVITLISQSKALQVYERSQNFFYGINAIIIALLAFVAFYSGRLITKPLVQFSAAAQEIGAGNFDINLSVSSQDELCDVAQSLNKMSKNLAETMATKDQFRAEIDRRQLIETSLRESESSLKNAQRIAKIGSWEIDIKTRKTTWSAEVFRLFDLTPQQFGATYAAFVEQVHPDDRESVAAAFSSALKNHTPCEITHRILLRDGSLKYVHEKGEIVCNDRGEPERLLGTVQDISEQHLAKEMLQRYNHILATTSELMSFIDVNYIYTAINQTYLDVFEKKEAEIVGHHAKELLGDDIFEKIVKDKLDKCFAGEEIRYQEWFELPAKGRLFLDVKYLPYYNSSDEIVGAVVSSNDITGIKNAESQRLALEYQLHQKYKIEAIGVMAGGISHNFNNNLSIILGNVELAQLKLEQQSEVTSLLDNAKTAVLHSRNLVQQILNFSHNESDSNIPISLPLVINETISLLKSTIPSTINLTQDISKGCNNVTINGNASQVQEVLINLCNNAIYAMDEDGELSITLSMVELKQEDLPNKELATGSYAKLAVKDTGGGMSVEVQSRAFDLFFSTKEKNNGTGVGLSTVKEIVNRHAGFINIDSTVNVGTSFEIYFPTIERRRSKRSQSIEHLSELPTGSEKILFLDDNERVATVFSNMLKEFGYQVTTMTSSSETLKLVSATPDYFDLIVTDQTMPNLTGIDMVKQLLAIKPGLRTILFTGYSSKISSEEALAIGVKAFCMKPLDKSELIQMVRAVLDQKDLS